MRNPCGPERERFPMTRIGVLSDTHLHSGCQGEARLQQLATSHFVDVDLLFHAGDLVDPDILNVFSKPIFAVRGNLDPPAPHLPQKRIVEVAGLRFGLIHGWGAPAGLVQRVCHEFAAEYLDCIVFGHSHHPYNQRHGETLLFNPGSPVERRAAPFHSVGILDVGTTVTGRIIPLD